MMTRTKFLIIGIVALISSRGFAADNGDKVLYKDVIAPVMEAKCVGCHGEEKQKGKLRVDSVAAMLKGGSEGASLVPGKPDDGTLMFRIHLPIDDDEHMPPESKKQLTKEEIAVLDFWIKSGAKEDATVKSLKASAEITKALTAVISAIPTATTAKAEDKPEAISEADQKMIAEVSKEVNGKGGNLMAIAQDTPQLRFSALNVAKEFGDANLKPLEKVGQHILWLDLARTQVSDGGLASLGKMNNLTRLHLENTKISDAGLDHVKGLPDLEYLNLYGTGITDKGIAKLSANKNLKKLFLWQTKVTDAGVNALAKAIPGVDINTGWKEPVKVAAVEKAPEKKETPAPAAPAKKPTPPPAKKEPETKKPETKPTPPKPKPEPTPAKKEPTPPAKTTDKPAPEKEPLENALVDLTSAAEKAKKESEAAKSAYQQALKKAEEAKALADKMKLAADRAAEVEQKTVKALEELTKAVQASRQK